MNCELEFDTWGTGAAHAALWCGVVGKICGRCDGWKTVGPPTFPVTCPGCRGTGMVLEAVRHG